MAFWCDYGELGENIRMVEQATLPVRVDLADYGCCLATPYDRNEFGLAFSVPESADISVESLAG